MKKNSLLKKLFNGLNTKYQMEWVDGKAIAVYLDKSQIPDIQLVHESAYPHVALVSVNVSSTCAPEIANFMLSAMFICNVGTAEPFYIDTNGAITFGEQAYSMFHYEVNNVQQLENIDKNTTFH